MWKTSIKCKKKPRFFSGLDQFVSGFGPVFWKTGCNCFEPVLKQSSPVHFQKRQKHWTGLDFKTLISHNPPHCSPQSELLCWNHQTNSCCCSCLLWLTSKNYKTCPPTSSWWLWCTPQHRWWRCTSEESQPCTRTCSAGRCPSVTTAWHLMTLQGL